MSGIALTGSESSRSRPLSSPVHLLPLAVVGWPFTAFHGLSLMAPPGRPGTVGGGCENGVVTAVGEDLEQARVDGLLGVLRDAEAELRRSYSRMLGVVGELEEENAGAAAGFGTTARLLAGVLNLSKGEARTRAEQAALLTPRRSLTGQALAPSLPATAAELAGGAIGPAHLRVITATMRRIPDGTHPQDAAQAEQTLATAARRFDPTALGIIAARLLAHLDPDGPEPAEEPETTRELRVRTGADGTVSLDGKLDPEGGARVLEVLGSLNTPRPPVEGVPDTRSQSRRDADALVEAMTSLLDQGLAHPRWATSAPGAHHRPQRADRRARLGRPGHRWAVVCRRGPPPRVRRDDHPHGPGWGLDAPGRRTPPTPGHHRAA